MVEVAGKPLYRWAAATLRAGGCERLVIVVPPHGDWLDEVAAAEPDARVVRGGATRQQSVRNGLWALADDPPVVVLVHDAARALTPPSVAVNVLEAVLAGHRCVTPVIMLADTVRQIKQPGGASQMIDRAGLRAVQTPQGFDYATICRAHDRAAQFGVVATDDVALCELLDEPVWLVEGDPRAFKITTPFDLSVAQGLEKL